MLSNKVHLTLSSRGFCCIYSPMLSEFIHCHLGALGGIFEGHTVNCC
jgi:hypothetical protein